jgi:nucleoid DNA-binding protein
VRVTSLVLNLGTPCTFKPDKIIAVLQGSRAVVKFTAGKEMRDEVAKILF